MKKKITIEELKGMYGVTERTLNNWRRNKQLQQKQLQQQQYKQEPCQNHRRNHQSSLTWKKQ